MTVFYDYLSIHQEHRDLSKRLPFLGDHFSVKVCSETNQQLAITQPIHQHKGSYSTSIQISVSGNRVRVTGNPSRINRIDNLFGFKTLDECVLIYNRILHSLGLPPFTKCTKTWRTQETEKVKSQTLSDGAIITEVHITTNKVVGEGNTLSYIKGLSTQRFRNSLPRLHTNGFTLDYLSKKGNARLIYPSIYDKANELQLHQLSKIAARCGKESKEYFYLLKIIEYCKKKGIVRFEQKLKSEYIRREGLRFYGMVTDEQFLSLQKPFLEIDEKLQVSNMTLENIAEQLLNLGIANGTRAANTTAMYALQWMTGSSFDLGKSQVKIHRARLRMIGIDIADQCDIYRHSMVRCTKSVDIEVGYAVPPSFYRHPSISPILRTV